MWATEVISPSDTEETSTSITEVISRSISIGICGLKTPNYLSSSANILSYVQNSGTANSQ